MAIDLFDETIPGGAHRTQVPDPGTEPGPFQLVNTPDSSILSEAEGGGVVWKSYRRRATPRGELSQEHPFKPSKVDSESLTLFQYPR
ncbi:hypothetical protein VCV18_002324 [Metarhizium anisopliae]